jgi:hypothetical protein
MKRIGLYGSIVVVALAGLTTVLLTPSASPSPATMTPSTVEEAMATWFPATDTPQPANTPVPPTPTFYDEYTFVILGQDETVERCWKGERCGEASHSDVFVIVHVVMADTPYAVAVLVPRNLYVPPEMMLHGSGAEWDQPIWSMQVYGKLGYDGVHRFVNATFGLPVQGVFVTKMDRFTQIVDALGGLTLRDKTMTGEQVLAFLRDNTNNWGCSTYDCEGRIFEVATALRQQAAHDVVLGLLEGSLFTFDPLYETDLGADQILWLLGKYLGFEMQGGEVRFVRLWTPEVERADTPLNTRGMVPTVNLYDWMAGVLKVTP